MSDSSAGLSRRSLLAGGVATAGLAALRPGHGVAASAPARRLRHPGQRPRPHQPAGTPDARLPFDHIVVVMMENHSFDNYFGMLPRRGQPLADGFRFDAKGRPLNRNPLDGKHQYAFHLEGSCQPGWVTQAWTATHQQIDGGRMDGFAATCPTAMGYWDEADLPFYYSLAKTFTLANRWFSSAPCQTYPNRRYLYAGTSSGLIRSDGGTFSLPAPPAGTIMDQLSDHGLSWANYFTDLPATGLIPQNVENHPSHYLPISQFFTDAKAGTLPAVSFVDPEFGLTDVVGSELASHLETVPHLPAAIHAGLMKARSQGGDEENPQDIRIGEAFVAEVVNAVLASLAWPRTLLVWTYDEHGGYYDHVPPPAAVAPDNVKPMLGPGDVHGGFTILGPRVPAVVVSPYSKPRTVTNVVHDHTSVLATIEAKWNLPALTYRDANARTMLDFLDLQHRPRFLKPPRLAAPTIPGLGLTGCPTEPPRPVLR